jgi:hypothetical protein
MAQVYQNYKNNMFPALLESPNVLPEDKQKITDLLKKPWNPYVRRHSALTEKARILKEGYLPIGFEKLKEENPEAEVNFTAIF